MRHSLPEHLNDDSKVRVLDQLHTVGLSRVFLEIALTAAKRFSISPKRMHLDGTIFHVHGEYKDDSKAREIESYAPKLPPLPTLTTTKNEVAPLPIETSKKLVVIKSENKVETEDFQAIHITHGYSRDHRPDLKQYLMKIMSSSDGDVPLFLQIGDGNEAEKTRFPTLIKEFKNQWTFEEVEVFVGDSTLYSESNIKTLGDLPWISRVPLTLKTAKQLVETLASSEFIPSQIAGYTIAEIKSDYGEVEQRWLVVESKDRRKTDLKQLSKQLDKQEKIQQSALQKLCRQEFNCEADACAAASQLAHKMKYHLLENIEVVKSAHYHKSGRPSKQQQPSQLSYHLQANLVRNILTITTAENQAGRFIIASL